MLKTKMYLRNFRITFKDIKWIVFDMSKVFCLFVFYLFCKENDVYLYCFFVLLLFYYYFFFFTFSFVSDAVVHLSRK